MCMYQVHELEALEKLAVFVLQPVGLVDDNTAPLYGIELRTSSQDHLKSGDNSLEPVGTSYYTALIKKEDTSTLTLTLSFHG